MTTEQKEIEQLRSALEYERRERYAAEMALQDTQDVGQSERPGQFAEDLEIEQWPRR